MEIDKESQDTPLPTENKQETHEAVSHKDSQSLLTRIKSDKKLLLGAIAIAVLVLLGVMYLLTNKSDTRSNYSNDKPQTQQTSNTQNETSSAKSLFLEQNGQNCKERDVAFSSAPMKMTDLKIIRPLGAVNDGHVTPTDHVYVGAGNPSAADNTYPVLMPADDDMLSL